MSRKLHVQIFELLRYPEPTQNYLENGISHNSVAYFLKYLYLYSSTFENSVLVLVLVIVIFSRTCTCTRVLLYSTCLKPEAYTSIVIFGVS